MKHSIFRSAILLVICLGNLSAQDSLRIKSFIGRKFEGDFIGATDIEWAKSRGLYVAVFNYQNEVWLAFYTGHGEKLASGRRLKDVHSLPLHVQLGISQALRNIEKKVGPLRMSFAIELLEHGSSRYIIPTENDETAMMLCADNAGNTTIAQRNRKFGPVAITKDLLARKN